LSVTLRELETKEKKMTKEIKLTETEKMEAIYNRAINNATLSTNGMTENAFNCGFAWIEFDSRSKFGKFLMTKTGGSRCMHSHAPTQDMTIAIHWMKSFIDEINQYFPTFKYKFQSRVD
jgi:hypothetical protein